MTDIKDRFSDLLALAEDMPSGPTDLVSHNRNTADVRLNGQICSPDLNKNSNPLNQQGSKGGHSLRNLDSRKAIAVSKLVVIIFIRFLGFLDIYLL